MRPVLLLQLGEAPEPVRAVHGGFVSWYERSYGDPLAIHDGREGAAPPDPRGFAGVLVTGSTSSLTRVEPWMETAAAFVIDAAEAGVPVLGVCFGHQLLGVAFGDGVVRHPRGWEIGTTTVEVVEPDPLFAGLPSTLRVNMVHQDVLASGRGLTRLAGNGHTELAAVAVGEHVRGVQFHPEFDGAIVRGYIDARRPILTGLDPDRLIAETSDSPDGLAVLANFRRYFIEKS